MSAPFLTICIPTYNRAKHLDTLLSFLIANILCDASFDIEVIVVNNCSVDATPAVIAKHAHPRIKSIVIERHRPTVEENIIRSLEHCQGEYVWFLGDDDVPVLANFAAHYRLLRDTKLDFVLFNAAIADSKGNLAVLQNIKMNRPMIEMPMSSLVVTIGCLFVLAGVSNQIIRRSLLSTERGLHYMACSQIYSMVAWIIEATKDARVALVNAPLVYYRENDYGNHWNHVAAKMGVCDVHFWSSGLVDLLSELVRNRALTYAQIGRINEVTRDGSRFGLVDDMLLKFFEQLVRASKTSDKRQHYSDAQITKAVDFFRSVDATTHDLVLMLKELTTLIAEGKSISIVRKRFTAAYKGREAIGLCAHLVERVAYGYEIIKTELAYVAVLEDIHGLREETLKVIDPLPSPPYVVVEDDLDTLLIKLKGTTPPRKSVDVFYEPRSSKTPLQLGEALKQLDRVHNSISWKITSPLRLGVRVLKKSVRGLRNIRASF